MIRRTFEDLHKRALKYAFRKDFKEGDPAAYQIACKRGILKEICIHMPPPINEAYTDEEIIL